MAEVAQHEAWPSPYQAEGSQIEAWPSAYPVATEVSVVSTIEEDNQASGKSLLTICIVCAIFLVVLIVVAFVLATSADVVDASDEPGAGSGSGSGGGGGGSGGGSLPPAVVEIRLTPVTTATGGVTLATSTTTAATTTEPIVEVKELVCTVGPGAAVPFMIPADGVCHYVYYTYVFVHRGNILATQSNTSFENFRRTIRDRTGTQGGLAFDNRYASDSEMANIVQNTAVLESLVKENIMHYGVLNVVSRKDDLAVDMGRARSILQMLKNFQGNDKTRKTIIAIGLYNYDKDAWNVYKGLIQTAANEYPVDTVIAITSHLQFATPGECQAVPPDVFRPRIVAEEEFAFIVRHAELVTESFPYVRRDVVVGLSLFYGARLYKLRQGKADPLNAPYADCETSFTTSMDVVCEFGAGRELSSLSTNAAVSTADPTRALFWDTYDTVREKVKHVLDLPVRLRSSWLYFDVHLADFLKRCTQNPMDKMESLKNTFGIGQTPTP